MARKHESTRNKSLTIVAVTLYTGFAIIILLFALNTGQSSENYSAAYAEVKAECDAKTASNQDPSPEAAYDLYHDNGPKHAPTCRQPKLVEEVNAIKRQRNYTQQLEEESISPPSLEEQCFSPTICN